MRRRSPATDGRRAAIAVCSVLLVVLALGTLLNSLHWVDRTFPGFFLMDNRVVPSVGLAHWTGLQGHNVYQRQVLRLDGRPVSSAREVYATVAAAPPGTRFTYELAAHGVHETRTISSMRFALSDYASLFGAYFLNGIVFTAVGIAVWILGPSGPTTLGTVVLALNAGAFGLSAMDLYGPAQLFRLHVTTEALFPATLLHLMLVFPIARLGRRRRRAVLAAVYAAALVVITIYQAYLYDADTYSRVHNLCMAALGLSGAGLIVSSIQAYWTSASLLVRKRLGIVLLGIVAGFAIPTWMVTMSGLTGGEQSINLAAFTAFLFPVSLAYAVVQLDLFEIDAMLRRGINYLLLSGIVMVLYAVLVLGLGVVLQTATVTRSPAFPLIFSVLIIVLLAPMREAVQRTVDRLYYRTSHNAQKTLERASGALAATLNLEEIHVLALKTMCEALLIEGAAVWLRTPERHFTLAHARAPLAGAPSAIASDHPLMERLQISARAVSVYDFADDVVASGERQSQALLAALGAEILIPLRIRGELSGFIALGAKKSGTLFTLDDLDFLHTFANQVSVAVVNALSYRKIEELNVGLEHKVAQRTNELANTNQELARSLGELERAYHELQRSQENLVRAEKMAALGRLTAGIAHEVNTPLGASLNALKMIEELVSEYRSSIGDTSVTDDDHRELAAELHDSVENVAKWMAKAGGYIRSIKAHTRNLDAVQERAFDLGQLIEDTRVLLSHRLRLSSCSVTVECPHNLNVYGDPGKLGQVLTNLITNAIDAYESHGRDDGRIAVGVQATAAEVVIAVEDSGCGIAPEHVDRVFEELFTTKPPGKGTGLGLSISRDIVSDCFAGQISVDSTPHVGSRFTLRLPRREPGERPARRAVSA